MKTTLTIEIDYDPATTDPEGLACAMDRLLETALSTPDILGDDGSPTIGEFFVAKDMAAPTAKVVLGISGGVLQDVFCSHPAAEVILVDWDVEGCDSSEDGVVAIAAGQGKTRLAAVAEYPVCPLEELTGTETKAALKAAGLDRIVSKREQYALRIEGPLFRTQRQLLTNIMDLAQRQQPYASAPGDEGLLEGLVELTDTMADQARDQHGIDCLLENGDDAF
jgi:hypothetical protein